MRDSKGAARMTPERANELLDLKAVMETEQGRRVLRRILDKTHVFKLSFSTDPHVTAFNEGGRQVGLALMNDMAEADVTEYTRIMAPSKI